MAGPGIGVGDPDGVVVIPPSGAQELHEEVQRPTVEENAWMGMIRSGRTAADLPGLGAVPDRRDETTRDGN